MSTDTEKLQELTKAAKEVVAELPDAIRILKKHSFVFDDLDDRWQMLAFTLYSTIVESSERFKFIFENWDKE